MGGKGLLSSQVLPSAAERSCSFAFKCFSAPVSAMSVNIEIRSLIPASILHSQIIAVVHPDRSSFWNASRSLSVVRLNFSTQCSTLLAGIVARLHPWRCQKQPCTNRATWYRGKTRSGFPGRSERWTRNRYPALCMALRTAISGPVFLDRTLDMIALRVALSTWSAILCIYRFAGMSIISDRSDSASATRSL